MSDHGSPSQVRPGMVVRLRLGAVVYTSRRMARDEADDLARTMRESLANLARFPAFLEFPAAEYELVSVRADKVTAVELRYVNGDGAPSERAS